MRGMTTGGGPLVACIQSKRGRGLLSEATWSEDLAVLPGYRSIDRGVPCAQNTQPLVTE